MIRAAALAAELLGELGFPGASLPAGIPDETPAEAWARSGALALVGRAEAKPLLPSAPIPTWMEAGLAALRALAPGDALAELDAAALLGEHAAASGLRRAGRVSPGGRCRLLRARDGWLAVSLMRGVEDVRLLPAWLGCAASVEDPWPTLARALDGWDAAAAEERARLLGLAVSRDPGAQRAPQSLPPWRRVRRIRDAGPADAVARPLVVDLSALWAGPLCGDLLARAGARVVKLESTRRPDGARRGPAAFFDRMNGRKRSVALDFGSAEGRRALVRCVEAADLVIEASRPRALRQLGIDAEAWLAARPGRTWIAISAHGRGAPEEDWVGFGDDAAVAAGLAQCVDPDEAPVFVGDAIADPVAGVNAALAGWASFRAGGGELVAVALRHGVARCVALAAPPVGELTGAGDAWRLEGSAGGVPVAAPRIHAPTAAAPALGRDTQAFCSEVHA